MTWLTEDRARERIADPLAEARRARLVRSTTRGTRRLEAPTAPWWRGLMRLARLRPAVSGRLA